MQGVSTDAAKELVEKLKPSWHGLLNTLTNQSHGKKE